MDETYDPKLDGPLKVLAVKNDLTSAKEPERVILAEAKSLGYSDNAIFGIKLALEEAMTNAVRHGNRSDPSKKVTVRYSVTERRCVIHIADDGPGFQVQAVPDPTAPEFIERPNGRGIMLIRAYMTAVCYNEHGNEVRMMRENECFCG